MDYSDVLFFSFPASKEKEGKGGKWGKRGVEKSIFHNFFNSSYPKISKN